MPPKTKTPALIPVLVTTEHRGVFFGYLDQATVDDPILSLGKARLCLYWSRDVRGFMGLASTGPSSTCRIGPPADIRLRSITSVARLTEAAVLAWEAAPWSS